MRTHVEPIPPSLIPSSAQSDLSSILFAHPSGGETKWTGGRGPANGRGQSDGDDGDGWKVEEGERGGPQGERDEGRTNDSTQTFPQWLDYPFAALVVRWERCRVFCRKVKGKHGNGTFKLSSAWLGLEIQRRDWSRILRNMGPLPPLHCVTWGLHVEKSFCVTC